MTQITTVDQLEQIMGVALPATRDKVRPALHELDRQWIAASPLVLIATSDAEGNLDVSPKGDPAPAAATPCASTARRDCCRMPPTSTT